MPHLEHFLKVAVRELLEAPPTSAGAPGNDPWEMAFRIRVYVRGRTPSGTTTRRQ